MTIERARPTLQPELRAAIERVFGKPLYAAGAAHTGEQDRFMLLHSARFVTKWQWVLGGGSLRAEASDGLTATISRGGLQDLIGAGLMRQGAGCADVALTAAGSALLQGRGRAP